MMQTEQIWLAVHAGLTGFVVIPAMVVWFLTVRLARRRRDPVRDAFSWLKACHPFFVLSVMLIIASDIAGVILMSWRFDNGSVDEVSHTHSAINSLNQIDQYANLVGTFFERIVNALFVIVFAELGNGFRSAQLEKPPPFQSAVRIAAFGVAMAMFALSVAYFGLWLALLLQLHHATSDDSALTDTWDKAKSLRAAGDVINFAISIAQAVYAGFVVGQYAGLPGKKSAVLYFVSALLDAFRWAASIVLLGKWILPDEQTPYAWSVVGPVFDSWLRLVILVLLLVIGNRRQDGLWSTIQDRNPGHQAGYPQQAVPSHGQEPPAQQKYSQYPPQQQENPAWQHPQTNPAPTASWDPHDSASPQLIARPEELDSRPMQQPKYYMSSYQVPVEVSAEKKV